MKKKPDEIVTYVSSNSPANTCFFRLQLYRCVFDRFKESTMSFENGFHLFLYVFEIGEIIDLMRRNGLKLQNINYTLEKT